MYIVSELYYHRCTEARHPRIPNIIIIYNYYLLLSTRSLNGTGTKNDARGCKIKNRREQQFGNTRKGNRKIKT